MTTDSTVPQKFYSVEQRTSLGWKTLSPTLFPTEARARGWLAEVCRTVVLGDEYRVRTWEAVAEPQLAPEKNFLVIEVTEGPNDFRLSLLASLRKQLHEDNEFAEGIRDFVVHGPDHDGPMKKFLVNNGFGSLYTTLEDVAAKVFPKKEN